MVMDDRREPGGPERAGSHLGESCPTGLGEEGGERAGEAGQSASHAGEPMRQAGERVRQTTSRLAEQARRQGADLMGQARERVGGAVEQGKEAAASRFDHIAEALRSTARQLHDEDEHAVASYTESAAELIERLTGYLHGQDARGLVRDAEDFARRRPEVFLGGALAAGFAIGRFLKSSGERAEHRRDRGWESEWDRDGGRGWEPAEGRPAYGPAHAPGGGASYPPGTETGETTGISRAAIAPEPTGAPSRPTDVPPAQGGV